MIKALAEVGPGQVVSYGELAAEAGYPGAARAVGAILAASEGLTWWRVIYHDGRLAPGKEGEQGRRLQAEGVPVTGGRVSASRVHEGHGRRRDHPDRADERRPLHSRR